MLTQFKHWLAPPIFAEDKDKTRKANLLNTVLLAMSLAILMILLGALLNSTTRPTTYGALSLALVSVLGMWWLMRRGWVELAGAGISLILSLSTALALMGLGSVRAPAIVFLSLASVMAGLLVHQRAAIGLAAFNSLMVFGLIGMEQQGWLPEPPVTVSFTQGVTFMAGAFLTTILVNLAMQSIDGALAHARQDLAKRQQIEAALHGAEARYRELVERLPVVVYSSETGAKGRWFYISPQVEALLGFTPAEWLAEPDLWFRQMHADDREQILKTEAQALALHQPAHMEYRLTARDGRLIWIRDECAQIPGPPGQPPRVQGVFMDITARKEAEHTVQRQLNELRVLQAVASGIATAATEDQLLEGVTSIIGATFYPVEFGIMVWDEAQKRLRIPPSYRSRTPHQEAFMPTRVGIVNWVATTGQPHRVADVSQDPYYRDHATLTASELCVPIKIGEQVLGVINAESDRLDAFSEADERLLLTIAGQMATALERLRAEAARQSLVARMEILHAIDTALLSAQSPQAMAQVTADNVRRLINCQRVSITPFDFQTRQAVYLAVSSAAPTFLPVNSVENLEEYGEHILTVLRRDEPYLINDVLTAEIVSAVDRRHSADGIRAWVCMPLFYQGQLTGALNLGYAAPGAYTPEQIHIAREVANQLSIALQHARLHDETREALRREQSLNEFVRALSRRLDLPSVLEMAVRQAAELMGAESGSLCLISADPTAISEVYDFNPPPNRDSHRLPPSRSLVWQTFNTGVPILTHDYAQHPAAVPEWAAAGLRAYMAAPVSTNENKLGVITLYNRVSPRPFTARDLALTESIGRQVAVAIENARLFAAEQRRVALLTALHETGLDLSAQLDLPTLLQTIMQRAAHLLGATMGGFYLMGADAETLVHVANLPEGQLNPPIKLGQGVAGQVAQSATPLVIEDYHYWPDRLSDEVPFCGVVSVPILWHNQVLGVISICDPQPNRFASNDIESVRLLAAQAAVAITNARLYTEQQHELAERKRAEHALEENERTLRALLDAATDPVFLLDVNCNFLASNQALAKGFGQTIDAVTGSNAYAWLPPELAQQRKAQIDKVIHTGQPARFEDYNNGWYDNSIFPVFDAQGQVVRLAVYTRNITEYKQAEAAIRQLNAHLEERVRERTAQLEAANKELEAFSYSVSHDLRAPLRAITGFTRILQDEHTAQLDPEAQRLFGRIQDNARRMSQLIDDLLNLSRLTRAEVRRQPLSLSALAHEVIAAHRQREPERASEWHIAPDLKVVGDPNLLKIVLENLLGNALKFTAQRSPARIEVGSQSQLNGERAFFVRDNGAGFDMQYADKLFGAFQRLHSSDEFEGTGIGLATVQRIIHRHGGRVWAEGVAGQGATFYFTLPDEPG